MREAKPKPVSKAADQGTKKENVAWTARPWFAVVSVLSLACGIVLNLNYILETPRKRAALEADLAKALPIPNHFFLDIKEDAFYESDPNTNEIVAYDNDLTRGRWLNDGVQGQMGWGRDSIGTPSQGGPISSTFKLESFYQHKDRARSFYYDPAYSLPLEDEGIRVMVLENTGGSMMENVEVVCDVFDSRRAPARLKLYSMHFEESVDLPPPIRLAQQTLRVGVIKPGEKIVIPMHIQFWHYPVNYPGGWQYAVGKIVFPRAYTYKTILGTIKKMDVRQLFNTPAEISPYLTGLG